MATEQLLTKEIKQIKKNAKADYLDINLDDLVMMQMAGDFENFVHKIADDSSILDKTAIAEMIEDTREQVTSTKLFSGIVNKTIEAQFGEKYAAVRELGQNAIDSYSAKDSEKNISFNLSRVDDYHLLRVRDYGIGMTAEELVKNLLIPYNSGKEFDPTKIGEHGIGWYSVVDLADFVKVVTRKKDTNKTVEALVFSEHSAWKSILNIQSQSKFYDSSNNSETGTEVTAFISSKDFSSREFFAHLHQYLGLVDENVAKIMLGEDKNLVNSIRKSYESYAQVDVKLKDVVKPLTMGFSKDVMLGVSDERNTHRVKNLDKLLYTQRGLFVKYDNNPFNSKTLHYKLLEDLIKMDIDFWIDIPSNLGLTKGRNDLIADHKGALLKGAYTAFENLFVDSLLSDETLLYHPSEVLMSGISSVFNNKYAMIVHENETSKFSLKREWAMMSTGLLSKTIDLGVIAGKYTGKGLVATKNYVVNGINNAPLALAEGVQNLQNNWPNIKEGIGNTVKYTATRIAPAVAVAGGIGYGLYKLYESYGWQPFITALEGAVVVGAGYGAFRAKESISEWLDDIKKNKMVKNDIIDIDKSSPITLHDILENLKEKYTSLKESVNDLGSGITGGFQSIIEWTQKNLDLYYDVEAKKAKKLEHINNKISTKYMKKIEEDKFLGRIMNKKIINAEYYFSDNTDPEDVKKAARRHKPSFMSLLREFVEPRDTRSSFYSSSYNSSNKDIILKVENVKLSIDDLIKLEMARKLQYNDKKRVKYYGNGDYWVDINNPIVHAVVDYIKDIRYKVKDKYDIKVLEDRIDNIITAGKEFGAFLYVLTPIGWAHMAYMLTRDGYNKTSDDLWAFSKFKNTLTGAKKMYSTADIKGGLKRTGTNIANRGYDFAENSAALIHDLALGTYYRVILPVAKAINPLRYPGYAINVANYTTDTVTSNAKRLYDYVEMTLEERKLNAEERKLRKEERQRLKSLELLSSSPKTSLAEKIKTKANGAVKKWDKLCERIHTYYQNSDLFSIFGNVLNFSDSVERLSLDKMHFIYNQTGLGNNYYSYMNVLTSLDKLISKASDNKSLNMFFESNTAFNYSDELSSEGFRFDKKRNLHISLAGSNGRDHMDAILIMRPLMSNVSDVLPTEIYNRKYIGHCYILLDKMLHAKTHNITKEYNHNVHMTVKHSQSFAIAKTNLRNTVMDYLAKNNIDLPTYVSENLIAPEYTYSGYSNDGLGNINDLLPLEFTTLANASLRKLLAEKNSKEILKHFVDGRIITRERIIESMKPRYNNGG